MKKMTTNLKFRN